MRRCLRMAVVVLVASAACSPSTEVARVAPETPSTAIRSTARTITILHVNDTHSHLEAIDRKDRHLEGTRGGLVKAASVITREKARDPATLLVHAGDVFQGDVYFASTGGVAELQLLSWLGLDAMTVGNHEFNLTPDALLYALAASFEPIGSDGAERAPSPVLAANLQDLESNALQAFVQPHLVRDVDGVRVGFFGLVVDDPAEQLSCAAPCTPLAIDTDFVQRAARQVNELRGQADVVVLLSHLGFDLDERIAREVQGVDAIIGGHDHLLGTRIVSGPMGKPVPIVQAGAFYEWVGKLTLAVDEGVVTFVREEFLPVDAHVPRFEPFAEVVSGDGGLQQAASTMVQEDLFRTAIAFAPFPIAKDARRDAPQRDSPVANLITDALRQAGGTDVAWTTNGLLTEGLPHGRLVRADAFRIVGDGFDPEGAFGPRLGAPLFRLAMPGIVLWSALQGALLRGGDYFPQVSGMTVAYDPRDPAAVQIQVGGADLQLDQTYTVTANLALVQGLQTLIPPEYYQFLPSPEPTEYEAVRDWMMAGKLLMYAPEGRILDVSRL